MYLASEKCPLIGRTILLSQSFIMKTGWIVRQQSTTRAVFDITQLSQASKSSVNYGPMKKYSRLLESGALKPDRKQFKVVKHLQEFYNKIQDDMSQGRLRFCYILLSQILDHHVFIILFSHNLKPPYVHEAFCASICLNPTSFLSTY